MKKGEKYTGYVQRVAFPNKGIVKTDEGEMVTVKNVIPGQKVSFYATKVRSGKGEGRLIAVEEPSPLEDASLSCAHFGLCGGCLYASLPMEEQLKIKEDQVKNLLRPVLSEYGQSVEELFEGIKASPRATGYRNKMEFSFGNMEMDGPLTLGLHKRGSFYDILPVTDCHIADADFRNILNCVWIACRERKLLYFHKRSHKGYLRHLLVRKAAKTGEILVDLITSSQWEGEEPESVFLQDLTEKLQALPLEGNLVGVLHTRNDVLSDAIVNEGTEILLGQDYFYEELLGLRFKITPFSFFQTNSLGAEVLYETVQQYVGESGKDKVVFDLYSGTGTIAQLLASVAKEVVGVEIVAEAVEAATENAAGNGLTNCKFLAGDVFAVLDKVEEKPDYIILDPPREGIMPKALKKILSYNVEQMVYVSCKPTSLARDLAVFLEEGYWVQRISSVDMFPGTANVETICLLSRKGE